MKYTNYRENYFIGQTFLIARDSVGRTKVSLLNFAFSAVLIGILDIISMYNTLSLLRNLTNYKSGYTNVRSAIGKVMQNSRYFSLKKTNSLKRRKSIEILRLPIIKMSVCQKYLSVFLQEYLCHRLIGVMYITRIFLSLLVLGRR